MWGSAYQLSFNCCYPPSRSLWVPVRRNTKVHKANQIDSRTKHQPMASTRKERRQNEKRNRQTVSPDLEEESATQTNEYMRVGGSGRAVQSFARMPADPHGELLLKHAFRLDPHPADHVIVSLAAGLAVGVGTIKERYVQMRREAARQQKCEELHRDKKRRVHLETPLAGAACGIQPHISNASSVATSRAPSFDGADTLERLLAIEAAVASRAPSLDSTADSLESMMALEAASEDEAASEAATEAATALSTADSVAPPVADSQRLDGVRAAGAPLASERRPASSVAGTADALMPADAPAPNGQIVEANTHECTVVTALMAMKDAGASSTPPRGSTDGSSQPGGAVLPRVRTPLLPGARLSAERIHALARGTLQHLGRVQVVLEPTPPYRVVSASAGWERLCGFPAAAIRGGTLAPIQGPWTDRAAVAKLVHAARNQEAAAVCLINYDHLRRAFEHVVYVDSTRARATEPTLGLRRVRGCECWLLVCARRAWGGCAARHPPITRLAPTSPRARRRSSPLSCWQCFATRLALLSTFRRHHWCCSRQARACNLRVSTRTTRWRRHSLTRICSCWLRGWNTRRW